MLGVLVACGTQQNTIKKPVDTHKPLENTRAFFDKVNQKSNFNALKISSKIKVENGSAIPTLDALVYIENDKKVWINLSALFFNVARGMATPQGIKAYEKYNKTYIDSDFTYLNQLLNVNFIDYQALQNLLLGKAFVEINPKDYTLTQNAEGYVLSSKTNQKVEVDGKKKFYTMQLGYDTALNLRKIRLSEVNTADYLEVFYDNWGQLSDMKIPQNVKIIIKNKKTDQILIENTKFDFSTMDTPYVVPSNYQKKEIK